MSVRAAVLNIQMRGFLWSITKCNKCGVSTCSTSEDRQQQKTCRAGESWYTARHNHEKCHANLSDDCSRRLSSWTNLHSSDKFDKFVVLSNAASCARANGELEIDWLNAICIVWQEVK